MNIYSRTCSGMLAASLALWATGLSAQEAEIATDRPDFTESAVVVPRGSVQIEAGIGWLQGSGDVNVFGGPEALVRWGLTERLELRFGTPDWLNVGGDYEYSGLTDGSLGAKLQLGPLGCGWDLAAIAEVSVPVGSAELTNDAWDPGFILVAGRDLNDRWSFGTQLLAGWPTAGRTRELEWGGTVVFGAALGERAGTFFEAAVTALEGGTASTVVHHGYTWLVSSTFQLDVHLGAGLSDAAPDFFVGTGLAARF